MLHEDEHDYRSNCSNETGCNTILQEKQAQNLLVGPLLPGMRPEFIDAFGGLTFPVQPRKLSQTAHSEGTSNLELAREREV